MEHTGKISCIRNRITRKKNSPLDQDRTILNMVSFDIFQANERIDGHTYFGIRDNTIRSIAFEAIKKNCNVIVNINEENVITSIKLKEG